jgi:hypothetical protein
MLKKTVKNVTYKSHMLMRHHLGEHQCQPQTDHSMSTRIFTIAPNVLQGFQVQRVCDILSEGETQKE